MKKSCKITLLAISWIVFCSIPHAYSQGNECILNNKEVDDFQKDEARIDACYENYHTAQLKQSYNMGRAPSAG